MANVLVVYWQRRPQLRVSVADHLYCFGRHARHRVFYLNLAMRGVRGYLRRVPFDLVIFHTLLLSTRWRRDLYRRMLRRAEALRPLSGVRAALPQDEFLDTRSVEDFVRRFEVEHLFSVAPESAWPVLYPELKRSRVRLHRVLTGYLEVETLRRVERLASRAELRPIDLGYRAWHAAPWLGRHGRLKVRVAEVMGDLARKAGLRVDVSTAAADTLFGDDWLRFLLESRWTLGTEGGASVLDRDGSIRPATEAWLARHPGASFEEVERQCFPGRDGSLDLRAISPRHLEACATGTGQVLVEGDYNGILQPGVHYLPLKRDFSNAEEVVHALRDEELRKRLARNAHRDVVASGDYTYDRFVELVLRRTGVSAEPSPVSWRTRWAHHRNRLAEGLSRALVRVGGSLWFGLGRWLPLERLRAQCADD